MTGPVTATKLQQLAFADIREIDPRLLVTAIAMMHLDTTHEVARTRLSRDENLFKLHGKIAPLAKKVRAVRSRVLQKELQSVNAESAAWEHLASRYVDDLAVSEADNQRFQDRLAWAAERGISLEHATKTIQVAITEMIEVEIEVPIEPKEEQGVENEYGNIEEPEGEDSTEPETKLATKTVTRTVTKEIEKQVDRLVADQDAIARNVAKLDAYEAALRSKTADNAHLRDAISQDARIAKVKQTLDELGDRLPLRALQDLKEAIVHFRAWSRSIADDIRQHLATARAVHDQIEKLIEELSGHRLEVEETTREKHANEQLQEDFRKRIEKFVEQQRQAVPELLESLRVAIVETEKFLEELGQNEESSADGPGPTDQKAAVS